MHRLTLLVGASVLLAACNMHPASDRTVAVENRAAQAPAVQATAMQTADVAALQSLTRILIDAGALYHAAAEDASNPAYAAQLQQLATSRMSMTEVFQTRVAALGGQPAESGQALGTAHRMFMEARTLGNEDTKVAVQEALRGENYLLDQLREASQNQQLGASTRGFLTAQLPAVTADRDRVATYAASLD